MQDILSRSRSIARVIPAQQTLEGGGVTIRRAFPTRQIMDIDPFLLLDHMGTWDLRPGEGTGFPDHPHRGFETVMYLLEGEMQHKDSHGHRGLIQAGGVQWMTAGSGLVHSEMPGADLVHTGGRLEGFQLWVNLPRRDKMTAPRYQELSAAQIPSAQNADGTVRAKVIAGEALGVRGGVETHTPLLYVHFMLDAGARVEQPVSDGLNVFAYVIRGEGLFGDELAHADDLVVFSRENGPVEFANTGAEPLQLLLIGGLPLNEPVERYGPFVMNTKAEIRQAFEDYRAGRMGVIE
jgi:redox-sensitive bicupin YhaK (pirin superfamily)